MVTCLAAFLASAAGRGQEPPAQTWTLERALAYALDQNPDARLARQRIAAARAGVEQANAGVWPRLQFQSSYMRTDNPMLVFGSILNQHAFKSSLDFNNVPDVDDLNVKGQLTMPLYSGGRTTASRKAAKAGLEAARQENEAVRNTLAFEVARGFHTVLKTREYIRAAEAAVVSYETNLTIGRKRFEGGTLLKSDLLDLEVRLAQAREDLLRARNARSLVARALQTLLGIEKGATFEIADTVPAISVPDSEDFSQRPEISAAAHREEAAEEQTRAAKAGFRPRVSAFGNVDYDYGFKFDQDGTSYTVGALLQWDLWDGFLTRGKVREARAQAESVREQQRKTKLGIGLEVEQARLELGTAGQRLEVSRQTVAQAEESTQLTRKRFEQGLALAPQLMDAETALVAARVRRAEAEADQRIAVAALRKALGLPQTDSKPNEQ